MKDRTYTEILKLVKQAPNGHRTQDDLYLDLSIPGSSIRVLLNEGYLKCCPITGELTVIKETYLQLNLFENSFEMYELLKKMQSYWVYGDISEKLKELLLKIEGVSL